MIKDINIGETVYYWIANESIGHCNVSIISGNILSFDEAKAMVITTKLFFFQRIQSLAVKDLFYSPYDALEEMVVRLKKCAIRNFNIGFQK